MSLKIPIRPIPRRLRGTIQPGGGQLGRITRLRMVITGLVRHERIEAPYYSVEEARGYMERLIQEAVKNGPSHGPTMEMVDYWLLEKELVPKMFNVLVPRYKNYNTAYTNFYRLPYKVPGRMPMGVLELRDNPWPHIKAGQRANPEWITNVLIRSAYAEFKQEKEREEQASKDSTQSATEHLSETNENQNTVEDVTDDVEKLNLEDQINKDNHGPEQNKDGTPV